MIRINLLPEEQRPIKRTPVPHILSVSVLIIVLCVMGLVCAGQYQGIAALQSKYNKADSELKKRAEVVAEYNALIEEKLGLQGKIEMIQPILSDRIVWSEWLHQTASLAPQNIWFKRIRVVTRKIQIEKAKLDKEGKPVLDGNKKPQIEKVQQDKQFYEVSGYAIEDETGRIGTANFAERTKNDPEFSRKFVMSIPRIEDTVFDGFAVRSFTFEFEILKG